MSISEGSFEPPKAGDDSLTDYLFDPSDGASSRIKPLRHSTPTNESHAQRARRILSKLASNNRAGPTIDDA